MSLEQLMAMSDAYGRRDAEQMLMLMTACQGDSKSWMEQRKLLIKKLK